MSDQQQDQQQPFTAIEFAGFTGLNTEASRPGIKDTELAWCDGFMPVGDDYLRSIPGVGSGIFVATGGRTVRFFDFANFLSTPVMLTITSDGSVYITYTLTAVTHLVAGAGTITNPEIGSVGISQWGSLYIILVANQTNGYFMIDSNLIFYSAGGIAPISTTTITSGGYNYTSNPSIVVYSGSGQGTGAFVFPTGISGGAVTGLTITATGSGYIPGDTLQLAVSGGGSDTSAVLFANVSGGAVVSVGISNGGSGYTSAPTLSFAGVSGSGAAATCTVSGGSINTVTVTAGGSGYNPYPPAVIVAPGYNGSLSAILELMPTGVQGTAVETYQGRVFVAYGYTVFFTAPEDFADFSSANGGGNFESFDSFLRATYTRPVQTNGFLYLIADSSINYIAGITTSGSPPTTTFTNQNADPETGTPYPAAIDTLSSNIVFANAYGCHVSYGGRVAKVSNPLDGIFNTVANFAGQQISSAKHILYGKRVWMVLVPVIDPISGSQVNKLFMWDEKKWWSTQQDQALVYIQHQEIASVIQAFGTDGTTIWPLFQTPTNNIGKTARSKLWAKPGGYMTLKSANRVWLVAQYASTMSPDITFAVDTEDSSNNVTLTPSTTGLTGILYVSPPTAIGQYGNLLGITITTQAADVALISATIDAVPVGYRG